MTITVASERYKISTDNHTLAFIQDTFTSESYIELTATGEHLIDIASEYNNIPLPRSVHGLTNKFTWHGPLAKTILMNL